MRTEMELLYPISYINPMSGCTISNLYTANKFTIQYLHDNHQISREKEKVLSELIGTN